MSARVEFFSRSQHTESVGDVDLVEVAAHDAKSRRRYERQVELREEAGFLFWNIERYNRQRFVHLSHVLLGGSLDQKNDLQVFLDSVYSGTSST
jgi:hypothetical protein